MRGVSILVPFFGPRPARKTLRIATGGVPFLTFPSGFFGFFPALTLLFCFPASIAGRFARVPRSVLWPCGELWGCGFLGAKSNGHEKLFCVARWEETRHSPFPVHAMSLILFYPYTKLFFLGLTRVCGRLRIK